MWSTFAENAKKGFNDASKNLTDATKNLTDVMEKAGDSITQAATKAKPAVAEDSETKDGDGKRIPAETTKDSATAKEGSQSKEDSATDSPSAATDTTADATTTASNKPPANTKLPNVDKEKLLNNLKMGWSSVVQTTKRSIEATEDVIKLHQHRLEQNLPFGPGRKPGHYYKRDPKLPVDVDALRDAEVVYVTDRIITMSHPALASNVDPNITAERKLAAIAHLLQRRHEGRYLVWNLSEVNYDMSILDDQVLTFSFPGSPAPPLGLLLKLLVSMENWMKADDRNVAVVHCLTGKGRTSAVLAAFLCWMGEAGFRDIHQALEYIALCKKISPQNLTIPSQRRYASYFKNMLDGVRPSQPPLLLKRIIMSEAPRYAKGPPRENTEAQDGKLTGVDADDEQLMGCAPYLQIFKGGELLFTTAATLHIHQKEEELPFVQGVDGPVPFHLEQIVQGDILIRCRHLTFDKKRVSMFRAAFHTGYVPPNVMRFTKSQLDGACSDQRFSDDFFLDLIFEKVNTETATKHLEGEAAGSSSQAEDGDKDKKQLPIVKASVHDSMLQGESRFWDVISARRKAQADSQDETNSTFGPTVGRRRTERKKDKTSNTESTDASANPSSAPNQRTEMETFSIGNEFDFLPNKPIPEVASKPKKDSLMEALNALDDEDAPISRNNNNLGTETVVFEQATAPASKSTAAGTDAASVGTNQDDASVTTEKSEQATVASSQAMQDDASKASTVGTETAEATSKNDMEDMDAFLALDVGDEDYGDVDLDDFDMDGVDDDLEDLENLLKM